MFKAGISGHQRLGPRSRPWVADQLRILLRSEKVTIGTTSLAVGADQLFAECVLLEGGTIEVVIPSRLYERTFRSAEARHQYEKLLAQAAATEVLPYARPSEEAFFAAGRRVVDVSDFLFAVWDGGSSKGRGGTADIVCYARSAGRPVFHINCKNRFVTRL